MVNLEKNHTQVTVILPKAGAHEIIQESAPGLVGHTVIIPSRGTLVKSGWRQKLIPSLSPEQVTAELVIPDNLVDITLQNFIARGNLHQRDRGGIFTTQCEGVYFSEARKYTSDPAEKMGTEVSLNDDLVAVFCILQKGKSDRILAAAMNEGSPGPTINYGEGHGIRDKMGIWRFAIDPQKEMIKVIVEKYALEAVFSAMAVAGRFDVPGMGFIYAMPVNKGLMNIESIYNRRSQLATRHEIIKAIDELKSGTQWRTSSPTTGKSRRISKLNQASGLSRLTLTVGHDYTEMFVKGALESGVPGLSVNYGRKFIEETGPDNPGIQMSKDLAKIEMVMTGEQQEKIISQLVNLTEAEKVEDYSLITQAVPYSLSIN